MYYATGGKAAYDKVKQMKKQQKTAEGEAQGPTPVPQLEVTHKGLIFHAHTKNFIF